MVQPYMWFWPEKSEANTVQAKLLLTETIPFSRQTIALLHVWQVQKNKWFPDGFKYSFVLLHQKQRILAYDNHEGKGHHRHFQNQETENPFLSEINSFEDLKQLRKKFLAEAQQLRKERKKRKKYDHQSSGRKNSSYAV